MRNLSIAIIIILALFVSLFYSRETLKSLQDQNEALAEDVQELSAKIVTAKELNDGLKTTMDQEFTTLGEQIALLKTENHAYEIKLVEKEAIIKMQQDDLDEFNTYFEERKTKLDELNQYRKEQQAKKEEARLARLYQTRQANVVETEDSFRVFDNLYVGHQTHDGRSGTFGRFSVRNYGDAPITISASTGSGSLRETIPPNDSREGLYIPAKKNSSLVVSTPSHTETLNWKK